MKRFVTKVLFLSSGTLGLSIFLMMIAIQKHHFLPTSLYYNLHFEDAFDVGTGDLIALGNSKLLSAIDTKIIDSELKFSSYNLGYSSSNLAVSRLTIESYLQKAKSNPKIVLLEVSWFSFNKERTSFHQITGDLVLENTRLLKYFHSYDGFISNLIKASVRQIYGSREPVDYSANFKKSPIESTNPNFNHAVFEAVFPKSTAGIDDHLERDLMEIVKLCEKNEIDLILFTSPESQAYSQRQIDKKRIKSIYKEIASSSDLVWYLDYSPGGELYVAEFETLLKDSHHLKRPEEFTTILVKEISRIHSSTN